MATFEVLGPDGQKYRVEGESPDGAAMAVDQMIKSGTRGGLKTTGATSDGGRFLVDPSGKQYFSSPGYSTSDPEIIKRLLDGETQAGVVGDGFAQEVINQAPGGALTGLIAKAGQGVPFVGDWIDEGIEVAGVDPRGLRQLQGAMDRDRPKTAIASEIAGGIIGSAPLAVAGAGKAMNAATKVGRIARGAGMGAVFGLAEGAAAAAGRKNGGDRLDGALTGGALGFGLGGALGAIAPIIGMTAASASKRLKKLDVRTIAAEFGISNRAAATVKSALANEDMGKALSRISSLGDEAMLADAGPATGQLLDAAAQTGGKALRVASDAVESRAARAGARLSSKLDSLLGPSVGVKQVSKGIAQRTAKARNDAYARAWQTPIDFSTGSKGEKVLGVLDRIPAEFMSDAVRIANRRAQMQGDDLFQPIKATIDDAGRVSFSEIPSVRQLHELKVGLQEVVQNGTDAVTGKMSPDARDASEVAKMLRDALVDASPAYRAANRIGGDKIAEDAALDMGRNLLKPGTTFEDVLGVMRGASQEARQAAKRGLREHIEQTLSNVRRTITDPNTDAREAMTLVKALSSRSNLKKARMVLGTDAKALFDELDQAEAALALRAATARNSATAVRQGIQGQVRDEIQPSLLRRTLGKGGNPLDAAREVTETIAGIDPRAMSQAEQELMAEVAEALTSIRGQDAARALAAVNRAMSGQPLKDAEADLIGRAIASGAFNLGHQAGSQALTR